LVELYIGLVVVDFRSEQGRTSAIFAQASYSRLSKSCRISFPVSVRAFRLGG